MAYGSIKVDNIIYDDSGDVTLPVSSIHSSISGILTVTGDIKTTGGDVVAEAGVFVGTLGAAATPTYTFSGDNNTGLYASAADQISITTSGTAKLTVKSDGKVGIGTTAPDYGIHLHSSSSYLKISNSGTGEGGSDGLIVGIDGTGNCDIWNYENKFIRFATNNSERLRIDSSGSLLIGGTLPSSPNITLTGSTGAATFAGDLTVNTDALFVDASAKNVGIGTSAPGYKLHVKDGSGTAYRNLAWFQGTGTHATAGFERAVALGASNAGAHVDGWNGTSGSRGSTFLLLQSAGGNVGIGDTDPNTSLSIKKPIDSAAYGSGTRMLDFKSYFKTSSNGPYFNLDLP